MRRPIDIGNGVSYGQPFGDDPATYSQFGMKGHNGFDYPCSPGHVVYAPEDGIVIMSGENVRDQYTGNLVTGETIVIKGTTFEHWLLHLSSREVTTGQHVSQGQRVGSTGNTGYTTGPHLHWGTRPLNPDLNNGYRGFVDPTVALNTQPAVPPAPLWTIDPIPAKQIKVQPGRQKWNLAHATFADVAANPITTSDSNTIFTAHGILHHREIPQYNYYVEDVNTPHGWNVLDCTDYVAPAPPPPPVTPPAAPLPMKPVEYYTVDWEMPTFENAEAANNKRGAVGKLVPGKYIVYGNKVDKAYNLTTDNMKPGVWVNISHNVPPFIPTPEPPITTPPLPDKVKEVIVKAAEDADMATDWKKCDPVKIDSVGRWLPVTYRTKNDMSLSIHSIDGKLPATLPLPAHKELKIVSTFIGPDGVKYARDDKLTKAHRYYALRFDMLEQVVPKPVTRSLDYNHDGDVNISDFIDYGNKYFKPAVTTISNVVKSVKTRKFVDGFSKSIKRDKVN